MTTLQYPSDRFPGAPSAALEVPEGWEAVSVPGTALAARVADRGQNAFLANVVLRFERRGGDYSLADAMTEVEEYARAKPRGEASEPFSSSFGGHEYAGRNVSWVDPAAGTVVQAHLFTLLPAGDLQDLVQITGSVGGTTATEDYPLIQRVIQQVTVAPGGTSTTGADPAAPTSAP
ncbi:hypothetical protein GCM10027446_13480 [Angustibacter peucedani]